MKRHFLLLIIFLQAGFPAVVWAQSPAPMTPIDYVAMTHLRQPSLSPDGNRLVFLRSYTDWENNKIIQRLYVKSSPSEDARPAFVAVTEDETHGRAYWSPDGEKFLTLLKRKDDDYKQAYLVTPETGAIERLTDQPENVESPQWSPDGESFFFLARPPLTEPVQKLRDGGFLIPEYETRTPKRLWRFDRATGQARELTGGEFFIRDYSLSRDGHAVVYLRASGGLIANGSGDDIPDGELWIYNLATGRDRQLTDNGFAEMQAQLSPDNTHFAFIAPVSAKGETYYEANLFVQAVGESKPRLLMPDEKMEVRDFAWDSKGEGFFMLGNIGLRTELFHYELASGILRRLTEGDHALLDWSYDERSGSQVAVISSAENPGEIYRIDTEHGEGVQLRMLTNEYADWPSRYQLPKQAAVRWKGRDGQYVEGLLVYPVGYHEGKRFPLAVVSHGGPRSSAQFGGWRPHPRFVVVLAGEGYGVLLPNYRGGTGYGDAFLRDMVGGYFTNAHHDVMAGIDAMIERGLADPEQLVKSGWSAGGHMANKLITETDRFKAVSSGAGASDWLSMYGESDVRAGRTAWFGGSPWEKNAPIKSYWKQSVIQHAWKVKTPTVFYSGQIDERVPSTQSILLYRGLKAAGVPTELYIAKDEGHGFNKPSNRLFKIHKDLAWFAKYLGRKPYEAHYPEAAFEKKDEQEPDGASPDE